MSNAQKWLAVGAESGAVSLYNNYDSDESDFLHFAKQRTVLNLTTKVTTIAFHPNGEIVAIASDRVITNKLHISLIKKSKYRLLL